MADFKIAIKDKLCKINNYINTAKGTLLDFPDEGISDETFSAISQLDIASVYVDEIFSLIEDK